MMVIRITITSFYGVILLVKGYFLFLYVNGNASSSRIKYIVIFNTAHKVYNLSAAAAVAHKKATEHHSEFNISNNMQLYT